MRKHIGYIIAILLIPVGVFADSNYGIDEAVWNQGDGYFNRHVSISASNHGTAANNPLETVMGTAACLQFASTPDKTTFFQFEVGEDWIGADDRFTAGNATHDYKVAIDWAPNSGAMSGTDAVKWDIICESVANGEAHGGASTTVTVTITDDILEDIETMTEFTLAYDDGNNPIVHEDHFYCSVTRDTAVANDFAGTVCVTSFELIYNATGIPEN